MFNDYIAGEYEHRNPFLSIILPAELDTMTSTNIRANTGRYVTHMDLHRTISNLLRNELERGEDDTPEEDKPITPEVM